MKKVILGLLALIFSIALVAGGYMLLTSRGLQKYAVEEDVSCPYSWKELRNGTYRLKIDTSAYPDGSWGVEIYPKNIAAASETSSEPGEAVFSILALNEGQSYVQVYCEQTEPFNVRLFEIGMQISVSKDREITVEETEHRQYDGITTAGEDEGSPVQWWMAPDGTVNLLIGQGGSWEVADFDPDGLTVTGPFYRQGSCGFEIQGKLEGAFPLTVYDGKDQALCIEVAVTRELAAAITSVTADTYVVDRSEEHIALEEAVGCTIALPRQAVATDYYVRNMYGSVNFLLNDREWSLQIDADQAVEDDMADLAAGAAEMQADPSGVSAYRISDSVVAVWSDGVRIMILYGEQEATLTDVLAVARQILGESHEQ